MSFSIEHFDDSPSEKLPEIDPEKSIPGGHHIPEGKLTYTEGSEEGEIAEMNESTYIPDDAEIERLTFSLHGIDDSNYTLNIGRFEGLDNGEVQTENLDELTLPISKGEIQELTVEKETTGSFGIRQLPCNVNVDPDSLKKQKRGGRWVTAYVELGNNNLGLTVKDIDIGSVKLNEIPAVRDEKYGFVKNPKIIDRDENGFDELMVKFPREDVSDSLDTGDNVRVIITGDVGGKTFRGEDRIRVI